MIFFDKHGGNTVHLCRHCAEVVDADSSGTCVKGSGPGQCDTCDTPTVVAGCAGWIPREFNSVCDSLAGGVKNRKFA